MSAPLSFSFTLHSSIMIVGYDRLKPQTYCPRFHGLDVKDLISFVYYRITFIYAFLTNIFIIVSNAMQFYYLHLLFTLFIASYTNVRILSVIRGCPIIVQWCALTLLD